MEWLTVIFQNPLVSLLLISVCAFLVVVSARILGVTRIGPIIMTNNKANIVTELIREVTKLEVERQLAPNRVRGECRRVVKDASDQTKAIIRGMSCSDECYELDTVLAGPVNTYIMGEVMLIVEKNHIAELEREAWNARKKEEFRAKMIGLEQVLVDFWPRSEGLAAKDIKKHLADVTVELFYTWDSMFERIRAIALQAAERNAEISREIDTVMSHYRRHGRLPNKVV